MAEDVLVIGAGPAGIASAYYLQQAGISYKVIDQADVLASTWAHLYPSLRLNTSRWYSHLPHAPFPRDYGIFPTGRQYHAYLEGFVVQHQLNIHLSVKVYAIRPEGDGYRVETDTGSAWYPVVISATGRFNQPYIPPLPGIEDFKGQTLHAHEYKAPEPFKGKNVLVVGNGPSGVDISIEIGRQNGTAHPVLLAMRTGIVLRPRYPLGLPKHLWMLIGERLPRWLHHPLLKFVESIRYRNLNRVGIKTPAPGLESSAAATRGKELIDAARAGVVKCVGGLRRFYADEVEVEDGSRHPIDAVIFATGYQAVHLSYFDFEYEMDSNGWAKRANSQEYHLDPAALEYPSYGFDYDVVQQPYLREVAGYPGLFLVGVFYQGKGAMFNFNVEANIAVAQIRQYLSQHQPRQLHLAGEP